MKTFLNIGNRVLNIKVIEQFYKEDEDNEETINKYMIFLETSAQYEPRYSLSFKSKKKRDEYYNKLVKKLSI